VLGRDCRFLQGEGTNPETRATLREAIDDERPASVDILNYRCNGQQFWNRLTVAPISDADGRSLTTSASRRTSRTGKSASGGWR